MKLTSQNVEDVFKDCLFKDGESTDNFVKADGILSSFGFHPDRLKSHESEIKSMLEELPEQFMEDKGGGWSFLNACMDKHDHQWGEHRNMEQLFCLGIALGLAQWQMPRNMWSMFPGGMPYVVVLNKSAAVVESQTAGKAFNV